MLHGWIGYRTEHCIPKVNITREWNTVIKQTGDIHRARSNHTTSISYEKDLSWFEIYQSTHQMMRITCYLTHLLLDTRAQRCFGTIYRLQSYIEDLLPIHIYTVMGCQWSMREWLQWFQICWVRMLTYVQEQKEVRQRVIDSWWWHWSQ